MSTSGSSQSSVSSSLKPTEDTVSSPFTNTETTTSMSNTSRLSSTIGSVSSPSIPTASGTSIGVSSQTSSKILLTALPTINSPVTSDSRGNTSNPGGDTILVSSKVASKASNQHPSTDIVVVHTSQQSIVFVTITSSLESTLRVPSSVTITDSTVPLTASPIITILSTSTQANGVFTTSTRLVADPDNTRESNGFLADQGQVAGVFTAVGAIVLVLIVALIWFIRRCCRRQRYRAWSNSLRRWPPPFAETLRREPHEVRSMQSARMTSEGVLKPHIVSYSNAGYHIRSPHQLTDELVNQELTGVKTVLGSDPVRDPLQARRNTTITNVSRDWEKSVNPPDVSPTPSLHSSSSHSIYSESLPHIDDNSSPMMSEPNPKRRTFPEPLLYRSLSTSQTPAPPRSHPQESQNLIGSIPLTPPSSHRHSRLYTPEMPFPGTSESFTPRTWLNVRPHTAPELLASRVSQGPFAGG